MNEILKCLQERRSCRSFLPKQVDEETLDAILTAGTYAASGRGRQSAKIVVLQKPEDIAALERMNAAVLGAPDAHPFFGAPTVKSVCRLNAPGSVASVARIALARREISPTARPRFGQ